VDAVLGLPPALATVDRCLVMGVVNVTPDSFSDGGMWLEADAAVDHGVRLLAEGADLIDVGGESTRPGADRVPVEEELRRVLPVIRTLAAEGAVISIDTMRAQVARAALDAGAAIVNDVSGGLADAAMVPMVATARVPFLAMHWRGPSATMDAMAVYDDVVADVAAELAARLGALSDAGMDPRQVILDPGLGFAKTGEHNWQILAGLGRLVALGRPILIGASRKRFLGTLLAGADGTPAPPSARDAATAATSTRAAAAGAWAVRVHDVRPTMDAVRVVAAVEAARRAVAASAAAGPLSEQASATADPDARGFTATGSTATGSTEIRSTETGSTAKGSTAPGSTPVGSARGQDAIGRGA
jgi:dihydropteroate synthase